jgi:8-oxo-dGTP diphosphatase
MNKIYEVVASVIEEEGKVFCVKRGPGRSLENKWEFPGGKIENHESHEEALIREIKEELNSVIKVERKLIAVFFDYDSFSVKLHCYLCKLVNGSLDLTEHIDKVWLEVSKLHTLDWAGADQKVINYIIEKGLKDI